MDQKTKIVAAAGGLDMHITREFELPLDLLFRAYEDPEIVEQWMGSQVLKLENRKHGSYQLEKKDATGKVLFRANGVVHDFIANRKITRTFEMENTPFGVQLEIYVFEALDESHSKLSMHVLYESAAQRDQVIQMGMTKGIDMAHNRLQEAMNQLK